MYSFRLPLYVSYFFALLFIYAAVSKIVDFENFQIQLAQSPLLSAYAGFISYNILALELLTAGALLWDKTRRVGLYAAFGLMIAFTVYIYLILNYSDYIPCSCGGILEKMSWGQHLVFNIISVGLAWVGIVFIEKERARGWSRAVAFAVLTAVFSGGSIGALFLSSEHIIKEENNFTRRFLPHPITSPQKIDLQYNSFYFAGQFGDTVFLGNKIAPVIMGTVLPAFHQVKLDTLRINETVPTESTVNLQVRYPAFSLSEGRSPLIFEGELPNLTAVRAELPNFRFSKSIMTEANRYIFRGQSTQTGESIMGSIITVPRLHLKFNTTFLEKQVDGVFDTDGNLVYDPVTRKCVYTYYYRNEYRILDSLLRFHGAGRTIDTISRAKIQVTTLQNGQKKMAAPPVKVNLQQAVYGGLLYNVSNLRGRYESAKMWRQASIVDVYDYGRNKYQYSFYIHHEKKNRIRDIMVSKHYVFVLAGNYLIRYQRMHIPSADGRKQGKPKT